MNIKKILQYAIGPVGVSILSFAIVPILAWSYDEKTVAIYAIIQALVAFSTLIFTLGVDQAFVRNYFDSSNKPELLRNALIIIFIPMIIVLFLINIFFYEQISYYIFDKKSFFLIVVLSFSLILVVINRILSLIQRMENQALLFSFSQILPKLIFFLIILTPLFGFDASYYVLIIAHLLSFLLVNVFFLFINRRIVSSSLKREGNKAQIKELLIYGLPLLISNFLFWGLRYLDRFYIKIYSNNFELALYTIAISISGGFAIFSGVFNTIWTPKALSLYKNGKLDVYIINKLIFIISVIGLLLVIILFLLKPFILLLFPQKYILMVYLLPLLILPTLYYTIAEVSGIGISIKNKTSKMIYVSLFSLIIHFILSMFLITRFGALGASIAIAVSFFVYLLLKTFYAEKVWRLGISKNSIIINLCSLLFSIAIGVQWM